MPEFRFVPSARLQQILGRELIADPNLAISEFVKNGYDAGATDVYVDFRSANRERGQQEITISDNGVGMDGDSFERNWMHPGYSEKIVRRKTLQLAPGSPGYLSQQRTPTGEKGLGRLAAAHLGEQMEVFTRPSAGKRWLHVSFDWSNFSDMSKGIGDVPIPYEYVDDIPDRRVEAGTIIVIRQLRLDWSGYIPGRKLWGRSDMRMGRLAEDLRILIQPLAPAQQDFRIHLHTDDVALEKRFADTFSPETLPPAEYAYEFVIESEGKHTMVHRRILRSDSVADRVRKPRETLEAYEARDHAGVVDVDYRPSTLRCGGFAGRFMYIPQAAQRWKQIGIGLGVFVYRDGVRVEPYGFGEDDWLGARQRKASRQGHAGIQPNQLYGYVSISRRENSQLVDMSNRQGLLENEAYEDFVAHARAEFREFERVVLQEYVQPQWATPAQKAQQEAERARFFGVALVRTLLHSINQPVAGLGTEMSTLSTLIERTGLPDEPKAEFLDLIRRSKGHLRTLDGIVKRFVYFDEETLTAVEAFDVNDAVLEAVERVRPLAESLAVEVSHDLAAKPRVVVPRQALLEAVYEAIANGVQAPRPPGRTARTSIETRRGADDRVEIVICDNGQGVPLNILDSLGREMVSTKGRPGLGLILIRELLALFYSSIELVETSRNGTVFRISIPVTRRAVRVPQ